MTKQFLNIKDGTQPSHGDEASQRERRAEAEARVKQLLHGAPLDRRAPVDGKVPSSEQFLCNLAEWMVKNSIPEKMEEIRRMYGLPSPPPYRRKKV